MMDYVDKDWELCFMFQKKNILNLLTYNVLLLKMMELVTPIQLTYYLILME